jgi:hypothetical protein
MNNRPAAFDSQAATFDQRAGLSEPHCQAIAQAVLRLAEARHGDLVFEVGAGTGILGTWFVRSALRYVGLDLSQRMLASFHRRLPSPSPKSASAARQRQSAMAACRWYGEGHLQLAGSPFARLGTCYGRELPRSTARRRQPHHRPHPTPNRQLPYHAATSDAASASSTRFL